MTPMADHWKNPNGAMLVEDEALPLVLSDTAAKRGGRGVGVLVHHLYFGVGSGETITMEGLYKLFPNEQTLHAVLYDDLESIEDILNQELMSSPSGSQLSMGAFSEAVARGLGKFYNINLNAPKTVHGVYQVFVGVEGNVVTIFIPRLNKDAYDLYEHRFETNTEAMNFYNFLQSKFAPG